MAIPYLGMMALGGGFGLLGNIYQGGLQSKMAQAKLRGQADLTRINALANEQARFGNLAKFIGQNVMDYGTGADLDFERQKQASIFDSTRKRDLERGANIRDFEAMLGMKENPLFRQQKQRQFKRDLEKARVERQAAMEGMFGPISRSA